MDAELVSDLNTALRRCPEVRLLCDQDAETFRRRIARHFEFPTSGVWWWEGLQPPVRTFEYGQGDGLSVLQSSLPGGMADCYLFLTDDSPPPWICLQGPSEALVRLLRELRFVECFFVDGSLNWILFDTHHNAVVGRGDALRIPSNAA